MVVKDRLEELKTKMSTVSYDVDGGGGEDSVLLVIPSVHRNFVNMPPCLESFLKKVVDMMELLKEFEKQVENVEQHQEDILDAASPKEQVVECSSSTFYCAVGIEADENEAPKESLLEEHNQIITKMTEQIRGFLIDLSKFPDKHSSKTCTGINCYLKIREAHFLHISERFQELRMKYFSNQFRYLDEMEEIEKNESETGNYENSLSALPETITTEDEAGEGGWVLYAPFETNENFENATSRHQEIIRVENTIQAVNELFLELQKMVETEAIRVDKIEEKIESVKINIERAGSMLKDSRISKVKLTKRVRKRGKRFLAEFKSIFH